MFRKLHLKFKNNIHKPSLTKSSILFLIYEIRVEQKYINKEYKVIKTD